MGKRTVPPRAPAPGPTRATARGPRARAWRTSPSAAEPASRRTLLVAALLAAAFALGRLSVDATPAELATPLDAGDAPETQAGSDDAGPILAAARSSTAALCPCPRPRPEPKLAIERKRTPPRATSAPEARDPTAGTAAYLKAHARDLAECAPSAGGEVRVHLEVTVTPGGGVERLRIRNVDPLPPAVSECVEGKIRALAPPPFDGPEAETFALTVVL